MLAHRFERQAGRGTTQCGRPVSNSHPGVMFWLARRHPARRHGRLAPIAALSLGRYVGGVVALEPGPQPHDHGPPQQQLAVELRRRAPRCGLPRDPHDGEATVPPPRGCAFLQQLHAGLRRGRMEWAALEVGAPPRRAPLRRAEPEGRAPAHSHAFALSHAQFLLLDWLARAKTGGGGGGAG
jgi:hypothetical protein